LPCTIVAIGKVARGSKVFGQGESINGAGLAPVNLYVLLMFAGFGEMRLFPEGVCVM
jgi:hypothetical protein